MSAELRNVFDAADKARMNVKEACAWFVRLRHCHSEADRHSAELSLEAALGQAFVDLEYACDELDTAATDQETGAKS